MKKISSCLQISLICEAEVVNFKTCASSFNILKKFEPKTKPNLDEKKETRKQYPFTPIHVTIPQYAGTAELVEKNAVEFLYDLHTTSYRLKDSNKMNGKANGCQPCHYSESRRLTVSWYNEINEIDDPPPVLGS